MAEEQVTVELEPGRWWRVVRDVPDPKRGDIYVETSDEEEARKDLVKCPWKHARLERRYTATVFQWRPA